MNKSSLHEVCASKEMLVRKQKSTVYVHCPQYLPRSYPGLAQVTVVRVEGLAATLHSNLADSPGLTSRLSAPPPVHLPSNKQLHN